MALKVFCDCQTQAFAGAACVSFNFTSNNPLVVVGLSDADQYYDSNYTGNYPYIAYSVCGATNCTADTTFALNATSGHYYFNISNPISNPTSNSAEANLSYATHPPGAAGE